VEWGWGVGLLFFFWLVDYAENLVWLGLSFWLMLPFFLSLQAGGAEGLAKI